jgi:Phage baseplate assembly protein W
VTEYDVRVAPTEVDFAPADLLTEIYQNVRTIVSTMKYTVPLDRAFGLDPKLIDLPMPFAQAKLTAEIIRTVHKYEQRCRVTRVFYDGDIDGRLAPTIRIRIPSLEGGGVA